MYKTIAICNAEDRIGKNGDWCKSYEIGESIYFTRSGSLWGGMLGRIKNQPYVVAGHTFEDFNDFSGWVQSQKGYREKEDGGRHWNMDKDLLVPWNTTYSKDTVCFIPQVLNNMFLKQDSVKREFPLGVAWQEQRGKFASYITIENKRKFLGRYNTHEEAHQAWQSAKINKTLFLRDVYLDRLSHKASEALMFRVEMMKEDILNGRETLA